MKKENKKINIVGITIIKEVTGFIPINMFVKIINKMINEISPIKLQKGMYNVLTKSWVSDKIIDSKVNSLSFCILDFPAFLKILVFKNFQQSYPE